MLEKLLLACIDHYKWFLHVLVQWIYIILSISLVLELHDLIGDIHVINTKYSLNISLTHSLEC